MRRLVTVCLLSRNLLKADYALTVYDIVGEPVDDLVTEGAAGAASSKEVAASTDRIITMLPDSADSEQAILGLQGVLEGARPGAGRIRESARVKVLTAASRDTLRARVGAASLLARRP